MANICLISQNAAGAFSGGPSGHIGGVERQTVLLANWLVAAGHSVSVIVWSDRVGQNEYDSGGVRIIPFCLRDSGLPILRFFWPRWWKLLVALRSANADIYVHNAAEAVTGQIALWAKLNARRFVVSVASEPACLKRLPTLKSLRERILYSIGIRHAAGIVVQTTTQYELLKKEWGLDSTILPMPCQVPDSVSRASHVGLSGQILWVGRLVPLKRFELFLEVVESRPDLEFAAVIATGLSDQYSRTLISQAESLPNLTLQLNVSFGEIWNIYRRSSILVCTSDYEGFPNSFLEAMFFGIPIVSTFDPGNVIAERGLGFACTNTQEVESAVKVLKENQHTYKTYANNTRAYFDKNHALPESVRRFELHLLGAASRSRATGQ